MVVGLTQELFGKMLKHIGALRMAQFNWEEQTSECEEAKTLGDQEAPSMYEMHEQNPGT